MPHESTVAHEKKSAIDNNRAIASTGGVENNLDNHVVSILYFCSSYFVINQFPCIYVYKFYFHFIYYDC